MRRLGFTVNLHTRQQDGFLALALYMLSQLPATANVAKRKQNAKRPGALPDIRSTLGLCVFRFQQVTAYKTSHDEKQSHN